MKTDFETRSCTEYRFDVGTHVDKETGTVTPEARARGYAAKFGEVTNIAGMFDERVAPGAFKRNLQEAAEGKRSIQVWHNHNNDFVLASTRSGSLNIAEDESGLSFDFDTSRMTPGQLATMQAGDLGVSFGFRVRDDKWEKRSDGTLLRTLQDIDLFEISPTPTPAYAGPEVGIRSAENILAEATKALEEGEKRCAADTSLHDMTLRYMRAVLETRKLG